MEDMALLDGVGSSLCMFAPRLPTLIIGIGLTTYREGTVTVGCGLLFAAIMPEYPHNARLLKPIERDYAVWRLEMEAGAGEAHEDTSTWQGFRLAVLDTKVWAMIFCMGMGQAMGTIVNFFP
jgi:hypothetical protein